MSAGEVGTRTALNLLVSHSVREREGKPADRYLYEAMHSGPLLPFSGANSSLISQPVLLFGVTDKTGKIAAGQTYLSTSFLNSTVALTSSAALSSWLLPCPRPRLCT